MSNPARELLQDKNYRGFLVAQTFVAGINGTSRFTFVWLVITLTDWTAAEGLVAVCLGLPAMLFSLPAGAYSDRVDRKRLFVVWTTALIVGLASVTAMIATGWATPFRTGVAAVVIGTIITVNPPNLNAMVSLLVPGDRLMNAVALQNGAMQAAGFSSVIVAGVAIQVLGDAGGFALLTGFALISLFSIRKVVIPPDEITEGSKQTASKSLGKSIREGCTYAAQTELIRNLLLISLVLGSSFAVMQISMPRVVEDVYEREAASAGTVLGAFGFGMLISSAFMANRTNVRHGRNMAICIGIGLGGGQLLLSFAPNLFVAVAVMLAWGMNAGVAMASHRTVLQHNTAPEMMGRVMGLMMMGFMGGLPIGAGIAAALSRLMEPTNTMRTVGAATIVVAASLSWHKSIRSIR
ncbi:MAG: MFS transporter [Acidimicrobiales bacterium]|nr:MFS transporter [Acidimicrobiales bacterium]MDG2218548.1 MFS transporter [Acidimicrobiales bacterium]